MLLSTIIETINPLEQGLKRKAFSTCISIISIETINPLEQGLKQASNLLICTLAED